MNWIIAIAISIVAGSSAGLLQRVLMRGKVSGSYSYTAVTQLLSAFVVLGFAIILGRTSFPSIEVILSNRLYIFIIFSAILYALNGAFVFKALQSVEISKFTILYTLRAVVTIIVATIFLNEGLTLIQLIGAGCILFAVIYVNSKSLKDLFIFNRGEIYALMAALSFGTATVSDKYLIAWFDYVPYLFIDFLLPALILFAVRPKVVSEVGTLIKQKLASKLILFSALYAIAALSFFGALSMANNASLVSSVGQSGTILTVILGIVLLKERDQLGKKLLAGAISFIGLVLLIFN